MSTTARQESSPPAPRYAPLGGDLPRPATQRRHRGPSLGLIVGLGLLAVLGLGGWFAFSVFSSWLAGETEQRMLTEAVHRGDLLITVTEDGNVESANNHDIKCQVAGGSSILWIVPDGTVVKKGEELVRLDSAAIEDLVNQQKITYEKAVALRVTAEKEYSAAKIAVQEYLEGTFPKDLQLADAQITIALENLRTAENALQHTARMARKGYVTALQHDADKFAVERAKIDLETARLAKTVLEKFTKVKMLEDLESKRDAAEAKMRSEQAACDLEQARLKRLMGQLEQCTITAPQDGLVVYANDISGRDRSSGVKIEEGAPVRERQSIVRLPDLTRMQVKVLVHESKVEQLQPGMRARVKIQDSQFQGEVTFVANQPEPTSFFSANVKEYAAYVRIDETSGMRLKPGMTAEVEILVRDLKDVLTVPVQAVVEQGGKFYCWVKRGTRAERRPVTVGPSSSTSIVVTDGVAEGEEVVLNPRAVVPAAREEVLEKPPVDVAGTFGTTKRSEPPAAAVPQAVVAGSGAAPVGSAGGFNLSQFDKDGDHRISREEAPERMRENFDRLDANADGFIDAAEAAAMARARAAKPAPSEHSPAEASSGQPAGGGK